MKIYVAGCVVLCCVVLCCVVLCCATIYRRATDVSKEHFPTMCLDWDGGVLFFRKRLGNCTVSDPEDQNVTPHISVCSHCAYSNLSCFIM